MTREYLAETVRRGLPLLASAGEIEAVPYWPALESRLRSETSVRPSQDLDLVEGWMLLHQGRLKEASQGLTGVWVQGNGMTFAAPVARAETWFRVLAGLGLDEELLNAWQSWEQKFLSPTALETVLPAVAELHPTAVGGLVQQAFALYPEDHRWLVWMLENPTTFPQLPSLLRRDRTRGPGLTATELSRVLRRKPESRSVLISAGYPASELDSSLARDYATLAQNKTPTLPAAGTWSWDRDRDGRTDHHVVFDQGHLVSWSHGDLDPQAESWTLEFGQSRPESLTETHRDAVWILDWEEYPWVSRLTYRYGTHEIEYQFPAFSVSVPLSPRDLSPNSEVLWPWQWDKDDTTLSLPTLVTKAATVLTRDRGRLQKTLSLAAGQVWMAVESTRGDGIPDQWSFYRSGRLDRIYRNPGKAPTATLQELYNAGEFQSFLADPKGTGRTEFALFPSEGLQLWDPVGSGTPFIRWIAGDEGGVRVLAFRGETLPWSTMPPWDPLP